MKLVGFSGYSGAGKTTLIERLIPAFRARGVRVAVIKHAHHAFDVDHEGKDSWRHRKAGAHEVIVASERRFAKMRDYDVPAMPSVHALVAELDTTDWVLVEGFKAAEIPKIAVWRPEAGKPATDWIADPWVVAVATDSPIDTSRPTLSLEDAEGIVDFLLRHADRLGYNGPDAHPPEPIAPRPC